jgi:hypothetical protein
MICLLADITHSNCRNIQFPCFGRNDFDCNGSAKMI